MNEEKDNKNNRDKQFYLELFLLLILFVAYVVSNKGNINLSALNDEPVEDLSMKLQDKLDFATQSEDFKIKTDYDLDKTSQKLNWLILNNLDNESNYFYSPYLISESLAIMGICSSGETEQELNSLLVKGTSNRYTLPYSVSSANSIWLQKPKTQDNTHMDKVVEKVVENYNTDVKFVDFSENIFEVSEAMSLYVSDYTKGYISDYNPQITQSTNMSVINPVSFTGKWLHNFDETMLKKFHGVKDTHDVTMMSVKNNSYQYINKNDLTGILIPYNDNLRMEIIFPSKGNKKNVLSLLKSKDKNYLLNFLDTLENSKRRKIKQFYLPIFDIDSSYYELPYILKDLGLEHIFNENSYYLNLSYDSIYYPENLIPRARLTIDMKGSLDVTNTKQKVSKKNFIVDKPFYFVIKDVNRDLILFSGVVNDL